MQNIMNHFQILHMVVVRMETMQTIDKVTACHNWAWCLEHIYFVVEVHCAFMHAKWIRFWNERQERVLIEQPMARNIPKYLQWYHINSV